MVKRLLFWGILLCAGCRHHAPEPPPAPVPETVIAAAPGPLEQRLIAAGLVNVQDLVPAIRVDLKYSTTDNFLHADVYGELTHAYLQPEVAKMLSAAWNNLQAADTSLTFVVYDAVRPLSIQQKMWEILQMPLGEKEKYLSNPKNGSIHNYGAAVDISLIKLTGEPVDMGTPFDFFGPLAEPQLESSMLRSGQLTTTQLRNRMLLRTAMEKAGFRQLPTEWWHYNACSREEAKVRWKVVE